MSTKKETYTKIAEDSDMDSGIQSGPMDKMPSGLDSGFLTSELDSGLISSEISSEVKSEEKKVPSVHVTCENVDNDSGLVLSEELSRFSLDQETVLPAAPVNTKTRNVLPPLSVLFKQDDDGDTQLHIAAEHGCEKAVSTLIKVCPRPEWFNIPNDHGHTSLHLAVLSGNAVVTRMLVIAGASLAVRDRMGETPLHKATTLKNKECIRALLTPVAELPQKRHTAVLNQKNYNGQACVHVAAAAGHVETLQMLVYYGADINIKENLAGWTPLHIAAQRGHMPAVQYLARCPRVAARARDFADRTPRRLARRHPHLRQIFAAINADDSDSDSDEDEYDSDSENESLFEKLQSSLNPRLVV